MTDIPDDPAEHARDFAHRYAQELDYHAAQTMLELGIPREKVGTPDPLHGIAHAAFHPDYGNAGGVSPDGRIVIEGGILNPALMAHLADEAAKAWEKARLRDRLHATIAHEYEEGKGGTHEYAVERAPDTELPISYAARELSRKLRDGERGRRATPPAAPSPPA